MNYNHVTIMGNLTEDPELKRLSDKGAVATLRLAINENYKKQDGTLVEKTIYVDVSAWGRVAENCEKYLEKGRAVLVDGALQLDQWETDDGQKRSKLKVRANRVVFLGGKGTKKTEDEVSF